MINAAKASYWIARTRMVCALAGYRTARLFLAEQGQHRLHLTGLVGLLIGLAVNFRLPNLFLSSGYFLFFFAFFLLSRKIETALQGMVFGAAFLAGMAPTLVANAINAGSPFSTPYGGADVTPPDFSFSVIRSYLADMQFVLLVLAMAWTTLILRRRRGNGVRQAAFVTARKSSGESCLLSQPPRIHAVLYNSSRNAFAVELAVCLADAAGGNSGR